jgi:diketogulonate reductase-like aldo/keto reductase
VTTLLISRSASAFLASPKLTRRTMTTGSMFAVSEASREALLACPTIALRDGTPHPAIGFGTYKVGFIPASASAAVSGTETSAPARSARECVADALDCGYRFLECAEFYGNEAEVGKAIADSGVDRNDLFLCSKVWTTTIEKGPDAVRAQLEKTLSDLGTDYIDLYCKAPPSSLDSFHRCH